MICYVREYAIQTKNSLIYSRIVPSTSETILSECGKSGGQWKKKPSCSGYIGLRLVQPWREGWIFERGFLFHNRIRHNASSQGKLKHRRPGQMSKIHQNTVIFPYVISDVTHWATGWWLSTWQERSLLEISLSNVCRFFFWVSRGMLYSWCWHVPLNMCPSAVVYIRLGIQYVRFEKNTSCNFLCTVSVVDLCVVCYCSFHSIIWVQHFKEAIRLQTYLCLQWGISSQLPSAENMHRNWISSFTIGDTSCFILYFPYNIYIYIYHIQYNVY